MARPLARWVGISLIALGVACLPPKRLEPHRRAGLGLFIYNGGLAILLACFGAVSRVHGFLLWPVVALHTVIAAILLPLVCGSRGWWSVAAVIDEATTKQRS